MVVGKILPPPPGLPAKPKIASQETKQPNKATSKTDQKTDAAVHEKLTQAKPVEKEPKALNEQRIAQEDKKPGIDPTLLAKKQFNTGGNSIQSNTPVREISTVIPQLQPPEKFITIIQVGAETFKIESYLPHGTNGSDKTRFKEAFKNDVIPTIINSNQIDCKGSFTVSFSEDGNGFSIHPNQPNRASVDFDLNNPNIKLPNDVSSKTEIRFIAQLLQSPPIVTPVLLSSEKTKTPESRPINNPPKQKADEPETREESKTIRGKILSNTHRNRSNNNSQADRKPDEDKLDQGPRNRFEIGIPLNPISPPPPAPNLPVPPPMRLPNAPTTPTQKTWPNVITNENQQMSQQKKGPEVGNVSQPNQGNLLQELQAKFQSRRQAEDNNEV